MRRQTGDRLGPLAIVGRTAAVLSLAALVSGAGVPPAAAQSEPDRDALARCARCHGTDGRSADSRIPHLRGQNYDYIVYQLLRFARVSPGSSTEGAPDPMSPIVRGSRDMAGRASELMEQHTQGLSDASLRLLARFYARLPCEDTPPPREHLAPPRGMAWCDDCHGRTKVRDLTAVPVLQGQWASYLEAQLRAFRNEAGESGIAGATERSHHFMTRSARSLSERQAREVAHYYARQSCVK